MLRLVIERVWWRAMGQSVTAIAYGVKMDEKLQERVDSRLRNKWGEWHGFDSRRDPYAGPNADDARRNGFDVLGFVVMIDGDNSEHPGAKIAYPWPSIPLGDEAAIKALIGKKAMAAARRKWAKLQAVAKAKRVKLPEPTLILCTVETA
jgi:hypothetical protein